MQKARSGLAAAAAKMQLVDAPEGKSSLQSRLNEAEKRAEDAESSAQDAQAALARTLLEAARVEAVVTARIKAESEAEIEALRRELDCMKLATSTLEETLQPDAATPDATPSGAAEPEVERASAPETSPENPGGAPQPDRQPKLSTDMPDSQPDIEPPCIGSSDIEARDIEPEDGAPDPEADDIPPLRIPDDARPGPVLPEAETPVPAAAMMRLLPPMRLAFLTVVAVVAVASYLVASNVMEGRSDRARVAMGSAPGMAAGAVDGGALRGTALDPGSIAEASAALDAELARLQTLSRKVASLRSVLTDRRGANASRMAAGADRVRMADRAPAGANWLLYMPVERQALVQYLAGRSWPGIQMAAQRR